MELAPEHNRVSLMVTLACTRRCPKCIQRKLLQWHGDYQMGMEELDWFIECTGSHVFDSLTITGGEPLLWDHLEEGVVRLRESGIARRIDMFSNGDQLWKITPTLMEHLDELRISMYGDTSYAVWLAQANGKVQLADRSKHYEPPAALFPADLVWPPKCNCPGIMVCNGGAYACANVPAVMAECGIASADYPALMCKLDPFYLDEVRPYWGQAHELCRGCLANMRVRRLVEFGNPWAPRDSDDDTEVQVTMEHKFTLPSQKPGRYPVTRRKRYD